MAAVAVVTAALAAAVGWAAMAAAPKGLDKAVAEAEAEAELLLASAAELPLVEVLKGLDKAAGVLPLG